MSEVLVERRGRVAIVTLNRPESLNGFTSGLRNALKKELQAVAADESVRAVVLTGAGRGFSAGADLKAEPMTSGAEVERQLNEEYGAALREIARMPKPVIAAVNGFATGIGGSFALVCDLVVMGEGAFFQVPFAKIGLVPDGGLTWLLTERVGHRRAFELAISGDRVPAAKCLEWNLANRVVPDDQVVAGGRRLGRAVVRCRADRARVHEAAAAQRARHGVRADDPRRGPAAGAVHRQPGLHGRRRRVPREARAEILGQVMTGSGRRVSA